MNMNKYFKLLHYAITYILAVFDVSFYTNLIFPINENMKENLKM